RGGLPSALPCDLLRGRVLCKPHPYRPRPRLAESRNAAREECREITKMGCYCFPLAAMLPARPRSMSAPLSPRSRAVNSGTKMQGRKACAPPHFHQPWWAARAQDDGIRLAASIVSATEKREDYAVKNAPYVLLYAVPARSTRVVDKVYNSYSFTSLPLRLQSPQMWGLDPLQTRRRLRILA